MWEWTLASSRSAELMSQFESKKPGKLLLSLSGLERQCCSSEITRQHVQ